MLGEKTRVRNVVRLSLPKNATKTGGSSYFFRENSFIWQNSLARYYSKTLGMDKCKEFVYFSILSYTCSKLTSIYKSRAMRIRVKKFKDPLKIKRECKYFFLSPALDVPTNLNQGLYNHISATKI